MLIIIDMVKAHKCKGRQRVGYKASQENHSHASQKLSYLTGKIVSFFLNVHEFNFVQLARIPILIKKKTLSCFNRIV